jgi:hypothetical protein
MDLSNVFAEIEGYAFYSEVNNTIRLEKFLALAESNDAVKQLKEATATEEGLALLKERIAHLSTQVPPPQTENPADTPLAVYLYLLFSRDPNEGRLVAEQVSKVPQCLWADYTSQAILSKEETCSDAGSSP